MKHLHRILSALVCLSAVPLAHTAEKPARPNVLFIIADDLTKTLPCYGYPLAKAPNVERLAARALRFDRAYCQYPVCMPSRTSFMSGRRPESTGRLGNEGATRTPQLQDAIFMPQHFKANGYFTARLGKVFHIGADVPECWDVTEEGSPGPRIVYTGAELEKLGLTGNVVAHHEFGRGGATFGDGEGSTYSILNGGKDKLIDVRNGKRAAELIAEHAGKAQPFFLACGFRRPHLPHLATSEYFDLYPADKMPLPQIGGPKMPSIKKPVPDHNSREALRGYLACVTFMDEQLGRVLDALDAHQLWDNTIVVLLGDHGYLLGSRGGWWGKGVLYNEAASTALLVAAPGKAKGVGCSRVVEFLDLYPTLADLCGLPAPAGVEGRSFTPLLVNPGAPWEHAGYTMVAPQGKPAGLAVSTERFRYLENANGSQELFDVQADPREWVNLADQPAHAADLARLKKLAADYKTRFRNQP
ncbi:MAG: sulfatase [Limisphaerales bacterium]